MMTLRPAPFFLGLVLLAAAPAAHAQIDIRINLPLPTVRFEAPPPLVVVQPGIQVVEDSSDEVFFVDNWYWVRRQNVWYRARDHRGGWVVVSDARRVPPGLVRLPPGQYKHFRGHGRPDNVRVVRAEEREEHGFGRGREEHEHGRGNGGGRGHGNGRGHGRW